MNTSNGTKNQRNERLTIQHTLVALNVKSKQKMTNKKSISTGWGSWDRLVSIKCLQLVGHFYIMKVKPPMLYGAECWATKKQEDRVQVDWCVE